MGGRRQDQAEHRSRLGIGDLQAAAEFVDDPIGYRQAEAESLSHRLGGEERIEDAAQVLGGNPAAVVGDAQHPVAAKPLQGQADPWPLLAGNGIQGVAQQVDQHLFQADRVTHHPGRPEQRLLDLHPFGADSRQQQLLRLFDHVTQLDTLAQAAGALAREGLQVAGERGHAFEHLVDARQRLARLVVASGVEQQAQAGQLHALGGERLVDLMGQGCRHLPQGGQLGRLHQAVLRGTQVGGALLDQALQLLPATLPQAGDTPALVQEQAEEDQRQPSAGGGQARGGDVVLDARGVAQQVEGPAVVGQVQRLPEVVLLAVGAFHPRQTAVFAVAAQGLVAQGYQGLAIVLPGLRQFEAVHGIQRFQFAVAPTGVVGEEHDALGVAGQDQVGGLVPLPFQIGKLQLDHDCAQEAAVLGAHRVGQEITGNPADHPDRIETSGALGDGLAEIGTETVIVAHVAGRQVPVARRHGQPGTVEQLQGGGAGGQVDAFQLEVEALLQLAVDRPGQRRAQVRIQRQYRRQAAEAFDQGLQRAGVEVQLLAHLFALGA